MIIIVRDNNFEFKAFMQDATIAFSNFVAVQ